MTELTYIPSSVFISMLTVTVVLVYFSFTTEDRSYYTDIISSFASAVFSGLIALNFIIGIGFNYALDASVSYDVYSSKAFAIVFGAVCVWMVFVGIIKVLELGYSEAEQV